MTGKVKCTCGWSWNKSDSSKKDMYICHECGRDNSNNMKNGGWLDNYGKEDNYNDYQVSAPEGFQGDGYSNVGRNSSPAWGGQFQMGGNIYPVNYVPQAQTGGSFPGATGFSYARTGSIPSKGPRRNKVDKTDASAQNGQEMKYYQEGLDWQPKTISQNGVKFDPKKFAADKKFNTPLQRSIDKEANSDNYRSWVDTKEYKDKVKSNKIANDKAIVQDRKDRINNSLTAQNKSYTSDNWRQQLADETQAIGDKFRMFPEDSDSFVDEWLNPGVLIGDMASSLGSAPLRAQQEDSYMPYVTSIGVPLLTGGIEGIGAKTNKQFINNLINPLNVVPGYHSAEKYIGNKLGDISTSIAPELRQGLQTAGPSFNSSELFDLNNVRKPSGSIGNQGATSEGANKILQSLNIKVKGANPNEVTLKEMVEHLKNNPKDASTYKKFLEKEPISVSELPGGEYHINDGHHRATLSYYSGNENIPTIIKNKGEYTKQKHGGIIIDDRGQWGEHKGEPTRINQSDPDSYIDMGPDPLTGIPLTEPLLGISDKGEKRKMYPGEKHKFRKGTKYVDEFPIAKNGLRQEQKGLQNLDNLTNFTNYNTKQPGGWLDNL